jgi:hypothetical protein
MRYCFGQRVFYVLSYSQVVILFRVKVDLRAWASRPERVIMTFSVFMWGMTVSLLLGKLL